MGRKVRFCEGGARDGRHAVAVAEPGVGAMGCLPERCPCGAFPCGTRGRQGRGRRGPGPLAASGQVAHTERTGSLVWRHMMKIFSPLALPGAIYCFSAAPALGRRARRCPGLTGATAACCVRRRPSVSLGCLGRKLSLPSH